MLRSHAGQGAGILDTAEFSILSIVGSSAGHCSSNSAHQTAVGGRPGTRDFEGVFRHIYNTNLLKTGLLKEPQ